MSWAVKSFEHYKEDFKHIAEKGALYAFFLYSTGDNSLEILDFVRVHGVLFNELAVNSNTDIFYFDEEIALSPATNPSAQIAGFFGLSLNELPGVLVFAEINEDKINDGVFFPLSAADFVGPSNAAVDKLKQIFGCLREMQVSTQDLQVRMLALRGEERRLAAAERWRKIREGMAHAFSGMKNLSEVFVDSFAKGLADAAAKLVGL
jgi:hypothetical protein